MGTLFRIKLHADSEQQAREAATAAFDRIESLDQALSDYIPDSELNRLTASDAGRPVEISGDLHEVLSAALSLARRTDGAFDPTLGHFTNLWRRAVRKKTLPTAAQLADARAKTGFEKLRLGGARDRPPLTATLQAAGMKLDLGGIAKGYAADQALARLGDFGITRAAVTAGGDIRVGDPPPGERGWAIPVLAMDREKESHAATVLLANAAVSVSGDREQFVALDGVDYSHIVDPRTGLGLTRRVSAAVIAPRAILSDSLATALCILGPEKGIELAESRPGVEALITTAGPAGEPVRRATEHFPE